MFSKKPEPSYPSAALSGKAERPTFSVIAADVIFRGNIEASTDLYVDGTVEGDIACTSLVQGETSRVQGDITAESARISGTVVGTINVRELVVLRSARIDGDMHYEALTIERGATAKGRLGDYATPLASPDKKGAAPRGNPAEVLELGKDEKQRLTLAS